MNLAVFRKLKERKLAPWALAYLAGAWLLLQVIDVLADMYDVPRPLLRAVPVLLGMGFLAAVVLAWYHGGKGRQRARASELLILTGILGLAGTAATFAVRSAGPRAEAAASEASRSAIAVLPLQSLSGEASHGYFAAGLHDELLTQLSRIASLKVISRTSVLGYADGRTPIRQIARELGVGSVVEGSVQVAGARLRVNVQLVDAATDAPVWSEHYDRTLDDVFAIQSDIAQKVVAAVGATLSGTEQTALGRAPTANPEAYRLYLQGRQYQLRPGWVRGDLEQAEQSYQAALELDARFALARAALSRVHCSMYGLRLDPSPARLQSALEQAEAALNLAPDLPQAHSAMAAVQKLRGDHERELREYRLALEALPSSAEMWVARAQLEVAAGRWQAAAAAEARATELNPRDATAFYHLGMTRTWMRDYAAAIPAFDRALALAPDFYVAAVVRGWTFMFWQGQLDTIRAVLRRLPPDTALEAYGTRAAHEAQLHYYARQPAELLRSLARSRAQVMEGQPFFWPTSLYRALAYDLLHDTARSRAAYDSALAVSDSAAQAMTADWRVHIARGLALAGLGRRAEALAEVNWLLASNVNRDNAYLGPMLAEGRARILAQLGDADAAATELEKLLARPAFFSARALQLDPLYDPIRGNERVQDLLTRRAASVAPGARN